VASRSVVGLAADRASAVVALALVVGAVTAPPAQADLRSTVEGIVVRSGYPRSTAVSIRGADGRELYARQARRRLVPASNEKLLTSAAALQVLGAEHRFTTTVRAEAPPSEGVIDGPVYLVGAGDPTLSTAAYARRARLSGVGRIEQLARELRAAGVRAVRGGVVGDGGVFDRARAVAGWRRSFVGVESPPLSGLTVDRNLAYGRPVWRPEERAAGLLRDALERVGIDVDGSTRAGRAPVFAQTYADVESPTLEVILPAVGKDSDNFTAEMLLKAVGAHDGSQGTTAGGAFDVRHVLAQRGLVLDGIRTVDGSGLSDRNRVTADFLTRLLVDVRADPVLAGPFRASLARAGVDGTLERRMRGGPAYARVRAKTGTLRGVSALSGYAGPYAFSVLVNRRGLDIGAARALQDRIAVALIRAAGTPPVPSDPFAD
jgi:D-alanyl-D-alanine carboxypeptidase/D-alanyl-D-alanine-endopeptidase (penicillin-binding protein 4)